MRAVISLVSGTLLAFMAASIIGTQTVLASVQSMGLDVTFAMRWSSSVSDLEIGLKVRHPNFGIGEILELDMKNNQNKAIVKFKSVGEKTLLLNFAKLKIIK